MTPLQFKLEHIADLKKQTWTITNYGLVLYGAIFAIFKEAHNKAVLIPIMSYALFMIAIVGTGLLLLVQRDLGIARVDADPSDPNPCCRGWQFLAALIGALWGGAVLLWLSLPYI